MAVTARGHRYRTAWGKQTAEGTAQATPSYEVGLYEGSTFAPTQTEEAHELADYADTPPGFFKTFAGSAAELDMDVDLEAAPLFWQAHLGLDTKTGVADPYTHTITRQDAKSFLTGYFMRPDVVGGTDRWERMLDGFPKAIELSGAKGQKLHQKVTMLGKQHRFNVAAPTPTNDRRTGKSGVQLATMIAATLKLDLAATPATTQVRNIESFAVRSEYASAEWVQTDELVGRYLDLGEYGCAFSATMVFADFASYASTFFGSTSITADMDNSPTVVTGAVDLLFGILPAGVATHNVQTKLISQRLMLDPPSIAKSGRVTVNIAGKVQTPASGEAISTIFQSAVATAY